MERGFAYCSRRNPFIFQWLFFTELHYIIFSKLNTSRPVAIHEAVNPKKICCFFCTHFGQIGKVAILVCEQGNFPCLHTSTDTFPVCQKWAQKKQQIFFGFTASCAAAGRRIFSCKRTFYSKYFPSPI